MHQDPAIRQQWKDIADNTANTATQGKTEAANAGRVGAPDDGHKSARNM
jgi:hypothetical protein